MFCDGEYQQSSFLAVSDAKCSPTSKFDRNSVKSMFVLSENGVCFKLRNPINPSEQKAKNFILRNLK